MLGEDWNRDIWAAQYKDPRWQKKRLEIFARDGWACQDCGDTSAMLHAHHIHYEEGMKPWSYEDEDLVTLCEKCHRAEKPALKDQRSNLIWMLGVLNFRARNIGFLCGMLEDYWHRYVPVSEVLHTLAEATRKWRDRDTALISPEWKAWEYNQEAPAMREDRP